MTSVTDPVFDTSPPEPPDLDDDLLLGGVVATFEASDSLRKMKATVLMVRVCWRLRWFLQNRLSQIEKTPLSRWRTSVYLISAIRRLGVTLPKLKAKRARGLDYLSRLRAAKKFTEKPLLHTFRSTVYGILFVVSLSKRVSLTHRKCAPLHEAMDLISSLSKVKLDESLNSGKCKVLKEICSFLETYLSMFSFILNKISDGSTRMEGLSACYYVLREIRMLLTQCKQYVRDCSGSFPSRKLFAKLESSSTIRGLILDLDWCLQLLSVKLDDFVKKNTSSEDLGIKSTPLKLFGLSMDFYLHGQAEKDQSDLLAKLKLARSLWHGLDSWKGRRVERDLLIARLEYERKPGREIDYLKHGLCVDPKNVKVTRLIGVGSSGPVQEVVCFRESYAMKTIVSELENASEVIIQAELDHPNIVKLVWFTTNLIRQDQTSTLSLLTELMGMGLDAFLKQRRYQKRPPLSRFQLKALHILIQIARAMKYLHSQQIIHRDLKTANVLVDVSWSPEFQNDYLHVKVCDFGISKVTRARQKGPGVTMTAKMGTQFWRAPEVLMPILSGSRDEEVARYSFSADVYSFAMTCYEVLTGREPFDDRKQAGLIGRIALQNERPVLPEKDIHRRLVDLIKRCWNGRPENRPSFDEICEELEGIKLELLFGNS